MKNFPARMDEENEVFMFSFYLHVDKETHGCPLADNRAFILFYGYKFFLAYFKMSGKHGNMFKRRQFLVRLPFKKF